MLLILQSPSQDPATTGTHISWTEVSPWLNYPRTGLISSLTWGSISYTSQQHILLSLFMCACHKMNTWEKLCAPVCCSWDSMGSFADSGHFRFWAPLDIWSPCPTSLMGFSLVQFSHSTMSNSATPWTAARQASLSITSSQSLLKLMSIESVMPLNHHLPLLSPSPPAFNLSQHQGFFKWVSSSHQVAKILEFQLQHQSFQWIFRTDFL